MICSRFTRAGSGARSTADRYHPFNRCQASRWSWGYEPSSFFTYAPASSARRLLSTFKLVAIALPNLRIRDCSFAGFPSVGPQRFLPPSSGWSVVGGGATCASQVNLSVPSGGRCGGNPEPSNGLSYAWGPGRTHSRRDGDPSPGCNPSRISPPSPNGPCNTYYRPGTIIASAGGSALTYP